MNYYKSKYQSTMLRRLFRFASYSIMFLAAGCTSCSSDHEHFEYFAGRYYYHDGRYYSDPNYHYVYDYDVNHYYYGRLEWKGGNLGWCIVLKENPYYGMICQVTNPAILKPCLYDVHDHEVMVRFAFIREYFEYSSAYYYPIDVINIHYN